MPVDRPFSTYIILPCSQFNDAYMLPQWTAMFFCWQQRLLHITALRIIRLFLEHHMADICNLWRLFFRAFDKVIQCRGFIESHVRPWAEHVVLGTVLPPTNAGTLCRRADGDECDADDGGYAEDNGEGWQHGF